MCNPATESFRLRTLASRRLTAVGDDDWLRSLTGGGTDGFDLLHDVKSLGDTTEDAVLAIEPSNLHEESKRNIARQVM